MEKQLLKNGEWFHGPNFLKENEKNWQQLSRCSETESEIPLTETIKLPDKPTVHCLAAVEKGYGLKGIEKVIDCCRYSLKAKLLRVTAYVLTFIARIKKRTANDMSELSAAELFEAEEMWIKDVQQLTNSTKASSSRLNQLRLFFDDKGIVRCEGRIEHSVVSSEAKRPILLPAKHHVADLIIKENHELSNHSGIKGTLNRIRERYWILHGRQAVKRVLRKYVTYKRLGGKPYATPKLPHLPSWRTSDDPPFSYTGLDFAGPLNVKEESNHNQRSIRKLYIALFTCASTRAIHLELLPSLSTEGFLQAFRRFSSRRGLPRILISDNAKTFKAASKELSKIKRSYEIHQHLANKGVSWRFIVEKAPWHGGFWERLIKSVKRCLKKSIGRAMLSFEELRTLLVEIESTLNNCPIIYVYDDEEEVLSSHSILLDSRTQNDNFA